MQSGQTFAFVSSREGYAGIVAGKPVLVCQQGDGVTICCPYSDGLFWRDYFDLDTDYTTFLEPYLDDLFLEACVRTYPGIRLLKQPVWETICSFILSANNHQQRIKSLYDGISFALGSEISWQGISMHSFPAPSVLAAADEATLRGLGVGYRAPYLLKTARMIDQGYTLNLDALEYDEALCHLMKLSGVGEKVADCILLFSTIHRNAFPVDIWMERVLRERYSLHGSKAQLKRQAQARFGKNAGIIQQFLFHGARNGLIKQTMNGN